MLESLEQEYRRDEDWCGGRDKLGPAAEMDHVIPLLSKHLEQKEAFLKVSAHCHTQPQIPAPISPLTSQHPPTASSGLPMPLDFPASFVKREGSEDVSPS